MLISEFNGARKTMRRLTNAAIAWRCVRMKCGLHSRPPYCTEARDADLLPLAFPYPISVLSCIPSWRAAKSNYCVCLLLRGHLFSWLWHHPCGSGRRGLSPFNGSTNITLVVATEVNISASSIGDCRGSLFSISITVNCYILIYYSRLKLFKARSLLWLNACLPDDTL